MQINGNIPFHVAQAYGVRPASQVQRPAAIPTTSPVGDIKSVDAGSDLSSIPGISRPRSIDRLIGASVNRPIVFDGSATAEPAGAPLQLYSRAADKIEVATALHVGRSIDVSG